MTGFSHWAVFVMGCLVGLGFGAPGGFAAAKIQISARKAAKAWREIRGWVMGVGIAMAAVVVVGLVGLKYSGMFG